MEASSLFHARCLEGVAQHEVCLLLHYCISDAKYFNLSEFNEALINSDYEYTESHRPAPITRHLFEWL